MKKFFKKIMDYATTNIETNGNNININGVSYTSERDLTVVGNKVFIDGKEVSDDVVVNTKHIKITVEGNAGKINTSSGDVTVSGKADNVNTSSGDVKCGNVTGSVKTMSGDVDCHNVNGDIETMSGDVNYRG